MRDSFSVDLTKKKYRCTLYDCKFPFKQNIPFTLWNQCTQSRKKMSSNFDE